MKFKVGNKVRVRNLKCGYHAPDGMYFNDNMEKLAGKIVTINYVGSDVYHIEEDTRYNWVDDFFEETYEFSKDLITDLSIVTLDNGDKLVYIKERDMFEDLTEGYYNDLNVMSDINLKGFVNDKRIVKIEYPEYKTIYSDNEVREMTVEEISKALGYEVKIVKEK